MIATICERWRSCSTTSNAPCVRSIIAPAQRLLGEDGREYVRPPFWIRRTSLMAATTRSPMRECAARRDVTLRQTTPITSDERDEGSKYRRR